MERLPRRKELTLLLDGLNQEIHRLRREAGWSVEELMRRAGLSLEERTLVYDANEGAMSTKTLFRMAVALGKKLEIRFVDRPARQMSAKRQLELLNRTLELSKQVLRRPSSKEKRKALKVALGLQKGLNRRINHRR